MKVNASEPLNSRNNSSFQTSQLTGPRSSRLDNCGVNKAMLLQRVKQNLRAQSERRLSKSASLTDSITTLTIVNYSESMEILQDLKNFRFESKNALYIKLLIVQTNPQEFRCMMSRGLLRLPKRLPLRL